MILNLHLGKAQSFAFITPLPQQIFSFPFHIHPWILRLFSGDAGGFVSCGRYYSENNESNFLLQVPDTFLNVSLQAHAASSQSTQYNLKRTAGRSISQQNITVDLALIPALFLS